MPSLPKSLTELKTLPPDELEELWKRYFLDERYSKKPIIKVLWYRLQCIHNDCYIESHHKTKLNRYSKDPETHIKKAIKYKITLKPGTEIRRSLKGKDHIVTVKDADTFIYDGKEFKNLSAVASCICGKKVSGNHFFGLHNKRTEAVLDAKN